MNILELLTEDEVEVAATLGAEYLVETVSPVDTHHTDHRQIDAHTGAGRTLEVERREFFDVGPRITAFDKRKTVDCGARLQHEREVELHAEARVGVTVLGPRRERAVVVTAQGDGLLCVAVAARHTVATDVEGFERRLQIFVITAEKSDVGTRHQHECPFAFGIRQRREGS